MTLGQRQRIFTRNVGRLIEWAYANGFELTFGDAYRPEELQRLYVERGLSQTMNSRHRQRLAVDFNLFIAGVYQQSFEAHRPLGDHWKSLHPDNVWGGDWTTLRDAVHFEMKP